MFFTETQTPTIGVITPPQSSRYTLTLVLTLVVIDKTIIVVSRQQIKRNCRTARGKAHNTYGSQLLLNRLSRDISQNALQIIQRE